MGCFDKNDGILFYLHKRRFILFFVGIVGLLFYAFRPDRTSGHTDGGQVEELYGFLHVMLNDRSEVGLVSPELELDLQSDNHISLYNPAYSAAQWRKERTRINQEYPVIVFSKSYCQYSRRAKELLRSLELRPPPKIIEVDLRNDAAEVKEFLSRLTRHSTFPNILVMGKSIGGSDDLAQLYSENKLDALFLKAGVQRKES